MSRTQCIAPLALALATMLGATACPPAAPPSYVDEKGRHDGAPPTAPKKLDALFDGQLRLIGADVGERAKPGQRVPVKLFFRVEKPITAQTPAEAPGVFVHLSPPRAKPAAMSKHRIAKETVPPAQWRKGEVIVDSFEVVVPSGVTADTLLVQVGLFVDNADGRRRFDVTPEDAADTQSRVEIGRLTIQKDKEKAKAAEAAVDVPKRKGAIKLDGVADEADWKTAAVFTFKPHDGKSIMLERKTTARMLWDAEALYLAFDVEDPDAFTVYKKRDDPLYDSEATEIFIDADGDKDEYVELQSAADDVHFDAAFKGGARKNMDKSWNSPFETKTKKTDKGYVQEWRIPVASLKDIPAGEPKPGARWKINMFRLERIRGDKALKDKVTKNEASAWSPPLSGDFHTLERFGTITFKE